MTLLIVIIVLALVFDLYNGMNDAANSIATIVTTKVLTPFKAVFFAAFFNFFAYIISKYAIGEFGVANTVSKTVLEELISLPIIFSGLCAAVIFLVFVTKKGIPVSCSHALIGGLAGAAVMACGWDAIRSSVIIKIAAFVFCAPLIGMFISIGLSSLLMHICKRSNPHKLKSVFGRLQLVSAALFSIGHGMNDAQKVMGIIGAALLAAHTMGLEYGISTMMDLPNWVAIACHSMIALGTMLGGWKVIRTMGAGITKVTTYEGVVAETAGAFTLYFMEFLKVPVSTTHTLSGCIVGAGATKRLSAVRWGITKKLVIAWVLTIPCSALTAAVVYFIVHGIGIR